MNYIAIYNSVCQRGKVWRKGLKGKGTLHRHHIVPRHIGGTDDKSNLTVLSIKEHALVHHILFRLHRRHQDFIAWRCLRAIALHGITNPWNVPEYREWMLPKVKANLKKAHCIKGGIAGGNANLPYLKQQFHSPEARRKSIEGRRKWVAANLDKVRANLPNLHTPEAITKMSRAKTKFNPVGPDGTVYLSIKDAAGQTGIKRSNIDNWIRRGHYGWSKRPVDAGEG